MNDEVLSQRKECPYELDDLYDLSSLEILRMVEDFPEFTATCLKELLT